MGRKSNLLQAEWEVMNTAGRLREVDIRPSDLVCWTGEIETDCAGPAGSRGPRTDLGFMIPLP